MPAKNGRNVSLTAEHNAFVRQLLASGRYASASEVVRAALRLLERAERQRLFEKLVLEGLTPDEEAQLPAGLAEKARARLAAMIEEGIAEADRGNVIDGEEYFARLRERLRAANNAAAGDGGA